MDENSRWRETDQAAVVITYYQSARQEIVARIASRDQAPVLYLTAVSLISTLVASVYAAAGKAGVAAPLASNIAYLLLIVPVAAFAVALVVSHHNTLIGAIEAYLATDLTPYIRKLGLEGPHWDGSSIAVSTKLASIRIRTLSHKALIVVPALVMVVAFVVLQFPMAFDGAFDLARLSGLAREIPRLTTDLADPDGPFARVDADLAVRAAAAVLASVFVLASNAAINASHRSRRTYARLIAAGAEEQVLPSR